MDRFNPSTIDELKRAAKALRKERGCTLAEAQEELAQRAGYRNFHEAKKRLAAGKAKPRRAKGKVTTLVDGEPPFDSEREGKIVIEHPIYVKVDSKNYEDSCGETPPRARRAGFVMDFEFRGDLDPDDWEDGDIWFRMLGSERVTLEEVLDRTMRFNFFPPYEVWSNGERIYPPGDGGEDDIRTAVWR